jgi:hypothetical protein
MQVYEWPPIFSVVAKQLCFSKTLVLFRDLTYLKKNKVDISKLKSNIKPGDALMYSH